MKNSYDEIKDLLKKSNNINIKNRLSVNEAEQIIKNLINEQEFGDTSVDNGQTVTRDNIAKSGLRVHPEEKVYVKDRLMSLSTRKYKTKDWSSIKRQMGL